MMSELILVIILLPLLSALFMHLLAGRLGRCVARISVAATLLSTLFSGVLLWLSLSGDLVDKSISISPWTILYFDSLSILMALVIGLISLVVHIYSLRYMAEESGYARFFVLLDLMTASLLLMVAAGDLITLIIAWHFVGVFLYFLLGQDTRNPSAYRYAFWTLITYRIGDLPLVLAAVLLFQAYGTWSLPIIFEQLNQAPNAHSVFGLPLPEVIGILIALAAFARSAQFLLHTWLPYTMDGPTPVSALMHAGIVNAGGFLINRFAPVFANTSDVLQWVFIVGFISAIIGSVLMLVQNDIKKSLGYSTMGQMGFMIMECGIGAFSLAIYHLIAHGVFKGTLFLSTGSVIHAARKDDGVPKDELYTFVVEKRPAISRKPWLLMAAITLVVPLAILIVSHWLVAEDYFQKQGAIILLFFGWITGAQLIFATYRTHAQNLWRLLIISILSFAVVILGYIFISHAFEVYLYPDAAFREKLFVAASIEKIRFDILVGVITLTIVLGWLVAYYFERNRNGKHPKYTGRLWTMFYALISRELYLTDLYSLLTRTILSSANKLNVWLRWN